MGTTHITSDTLFLSASDFLPGDICSYGDNLNNLGSLPASVSEQITSASGPLCAYVAFGDNFFSPAITIGAGGQTSALMHTVPAGSYIQWAGFIHLLPSTPPSVGGTCAFTVTLTGTAGTSDAATGSISQEGGTEVRLAHPVRQIQKSRSPPNVPPVNEGSPCP